MRWSKASKKIFKYPTSWIFSHGECSIFPHKQGSRSHVILSKLSSRSSRRSTLFSVASRALFLITSLYSSRFNVKLDFIRTNFSHRLSEPANSVAVRGRTIIPINVQMYMGTPHGYLVLVMRCYRVNIGHLIFRYQDIVNIFLQKYWTAWFTCHSLQKMGSIDGSFII